MAFNLSLSDDEALVLFAWLSREDEREKIPFEHPAERETLWAIEAQLEQKLVVTFSPGYLALLAEARERIVSSGSSK